MSIGRKIIFLSYWHLLSRCLFKDAKNRMLRCDSGMQGFEIEQALISAWVSNGSAESWQPDFLSCDGDAISSMTVGYSSAS